MRESHKSKRVSWASDVNLCQVRLFLSEDSPSQVGVDSQDHLQAKTSWLSHQTGTPGPDDVLPPGFEAAHPPNQLQTILSQIPTIKWKCPPRFALEITWQVVAGEESEEAGLQNQREMRVLEAIYPRPSAIPPNPSVAPNTQETAYDDGRTPSIPITPIEDEDAPADTLSEATTQYDASKSAQSLQYPSGSQHSTLHRLNPPIAEKQAAGMALGAEPSLLAAALTGLVNRNEQGNMIDHDLLLEILSNPNMVEKLVRDYGTTTATANTAANGAMHNSPPISRSSTVSMSDQPPMHISRTQPPSSIPMSASAPSGPHYPPQNGATMGHLPNSRLPLQNMPTPGAPAKDLSYYKSLIHQHGGDRIEAPPPSGPLQYGNRYNLQSSTNQEPANGHKPRDSKPKIMKPCIYFNSSRGCRHGANCAYQHDVSFPQRDSSMPEVQSAKRAKIDREISS